MPDEPAISEESEEAKEIGTPSTISMQLTHISGAVGRLAEKTEKLEARFGRVEAQQEKHSFALFGFEGVDGLITNFKGLSNQVAAMDMKLDTYSNRLGTDIAEVNVEIEQRFAKLMKYALASIVTFCFTTLPLVILMIIQLNRKH